MRLELEVCLALQIEFQFTHPVWGATNTFWLSILLYAFQFTHPVWGATSLSTLAFYGIDVSIHAPRVGCDVQCLSNYSLSPSFNSRTPCGVRRVALIEDIAYIMFQFTHPVWGATNEFKRKMNKLYVSIHAPRVGCDLPASSFSVSFERFNSRTPCGVRPLDREIYHIFTEFQFTHPVWGATLAPPG